MVLKHSNLIPPSQARQTRPHLMGMGMILIATVSFSFMSALVRAGSGHFRADTMVFTRCVIQCLCTLPWILSFWPGREQLAATARVHFIRGTVGIFSMLMLFYALGRLPLGLASLITMTSVLWSSLFGWLFLGERQGRRRLWLAALACTGFAVALIPEGGSDQWNVPWDGALAALLAGVSMGVAYTLVRQMRRTRGTVEIVFWFGAVGAILTAPLFLRDPQWPVDQAQWGLVLGTGLFAVGGQFLMTAGFRYTPMLMGSLCAMSGALWNLLLGWVFFAELPSVYFWSGASVVGLALVALMLSRETSPAASKLSKN